MLIKKVPVLRALLPYLAGVLTALLIPGNQVLTPAILFLIVFILTILFLFVRKNLVSLKSYTAMVFIQSGLFMFGFVNVNLQNVSSHQNYFANLEVEEAVYVLRLTEPLSEAKASYTVTAEVQKLAENESVQNTKGRLLLYFEKSPKAKALEYGDIILTRKQPSEIQPNKNPYAFDYSRYQFFRKVYHQLYLRDTDWEHSKLNEQNRIWQQVYQTRFQMLSWLRDLINEEDDLAVASALLLGYRDDISDGLRDAYAVSGAMHILAVSGLHVGIIFFVFHFLLKNLRQVKYGYIIQPLIMIMILWFYACLTGLSPSVTRAATMFSFVVIGLSLQRPASVYNSVCFSAFLLLIINPYLISFVGFQLSYTAVLGIVFFQPKIYNLINVKNIILDKAWALCAVSIAAQMATAPFAIYYFNQLPAYFLITNLIAIPAATLILYTGFLYFFFQFTGLSILASYTGAGLEFLLSTLNLCISYINNLPYARIGGLSIMAYEVVGMLILMMLLALVLTYRKAVYLMTFSVFFSLLCASLLYNWAENQLKDEIVVFSVHRQSYVGITQEGEAALLYSPERSEEDIISDLAFNLSPYFKRRGTEIQNLQMIPMSIESEKSKNAFISYPFIHAAGKRMLIIDKKIAGIKEQLLEAGIQADIALIRDNPEVSVSDIMHRLSVEKLIFDASNAPWNTESWHNDCLKTGIFCHDVRKKGPFILSKHRLLK